jgi:rubrerythrin
MKNKLLRQGNSVADFTDALVNILSYADNSVAYPDIDGVKQDDGVMAEWFYPVFKGTNDFSEMSAILLYTGQESKFEKIGELVLGIALIEMKHYDKLSDIIANLGGDVEQVYSSKFVKLGTNINEALSNAIQAEKATIEFYSKLKTKILDREQTKTTGIAIQLLSKLIADEMLHQSLLEDKLKEYKI